MKNRLLAIGTDVRRNKMLSIRIALTIAHSFVILCVCECVWELILYVICVDLSGSMLDAGGTEVRGWMDGDA